MRGHFGIAWWCGLWWWLWACAFTAFAEGAFWISEHKRMTFAQWFVWKFLAGSTFCNQRAFECLAEGDLAEDNK